MTATSPVICAPVRTPIGRYGGMFKSLTAVELGVAALRGLLQRTGIPAEAVQDVILGHCYPSSEAPAIGRVVALDAGLPVTVPGMQVDRRCGSGLQAVIQACMQVASGANDLVIAGGHELGQVEFAAGLVVEHPAGAAHDVVGRVLLFGSGTGGLRGRGSCSRCIRGRNPAWSGD